MPPNAHLVFAVTPVPIHMCWIHLFFLLYRSHRHHDLWGGWNPTIYELLYVQSYISIRITYAVYCLYVRPVIINPRERMREGKWIVLFYEILPTTYQFYLKSGYTYMPATQNSIYFSAQKKLIELQTSACNLWLATCLVFFFSTNLQYINFAKLLPTAIGDRSRELDAFDSNKKIS